MISKRVWTTEDESLYREQIELPAGGTTAYVEAGMTLLEHAISYLSSEMLAFNEDDINEALEILDRAHYALTVELDSTY